MAAKEFGLVCLDGGYPSVFSYRLDYNGAPSGRTTALHPVVIFRCKFTWKLPRGNSSGWTRSIHFFRSDSSVMARESFFHFEATLGGTYFETRSCAASQKFILDASEPNL